MGGLALVEDATQTVRTFDDSINGRRDGSVGSRSLQRMQDIENNAIAVQSLRRGRFARPSDLFIFNIQNDALVNLRDFARGI